MSPRMKTDTFGPGDQSWLVNTEGLRDAITGTLRLASFTSGSDYPNGYIPSGYPLARIKSGTGTGEYGPFDTTKTNGQEVHVGFLVTDQSVLGTADLPSAILPHGGVKVAKLPVAFDPTDDGVSPRFTYL